MAYKYDTHSSHYKKRHSAARRVPCGCLGLDGFEQFLSILRLARELLLLPAGCLGFLHAAQFLGGVFQFPVGVGVLSRSLPCTMETLSAAIAKIMNPSLTNLPFWVTRTTLLVDKTYCTNYDSLIFRRKKDETVCIRKKFVITVGFWTRTCAS